MDKSLKADFHIHTEYSLDCTTALEDIISRCLETGINCIAVTDHEAIEGAFKMKEIAPFKVVIAEEILTTQGEVIGMFIKEHVPVALTIEETIARIKAQGGLVCLPHPFDIYRGLSMDGKKLESLVDQIDIVEVFNARSPLRRYSAKARSFAKKHDLPGSAGSDAHTLPEIGSTYVEMPDFTGRDDFLQALREGRISGRRSNPLAHFGSTWARLKKLF